MSITVPVLNEVLGPVLRHPFVGSSGSAPPPPVKFIITQMTFNEGTNLLSVTFSKAPTTINNTGWTVDVDGAGYVTPIFDSVVGNVGYFLIPKTELASLVYVTYDDGVGNTESGGEALPGVTGQKATPRPGELSFAAAGSLHLFTDGQVSNHILLDIAAGTGEPTYSNDGLTLPDHAGVYQTNKENEPPWYGARRVYCIVLNNTDLSNLSWSQTNGSREYGRPDPDGGNEAVLLTHLSATASAFFQSNRPINGDTTIQSWWIRRVTGTGTVEMYVGSGTTRVTVPVTGTWQRLTSGVGPPAGSSGNNHCGVVLNAIGDQIEVWHPQMEVVNGRSEQVPSEFIETTSAPVTRWYDNANGNTVLNNVVTEADGPVIAPYPKLYCAPSLLNRQTRSYKLANWTTQGIGGIDQASYTGLEGRVGRCSRVTDADAGSYYACTSDITINPTAQVTTQWAIRKQASQTAWPGLGNATGNGFSANYIAFNQVTGEYNVLAGSFDKIIVDGSNPEWWFVTLQVPNLGSPYPQKIWAALSIDGLSVSGSAQGFVDVGYAFCCEEVDADRVKASAPILTNGSAVNQAASYADYPQANHADDQGAYFCEGTLLSFNGGSDSLIGVGTSGRLMYWSTTANQNTFDGTNARTVSSPWVEGVTKKVANAYGAAEGLNRLTVDGVSQEGAYDGSWNPTLLRAGGYHAITQPRVNSVALIGNIRRYDLPYAEAKAKIDEIMGTVAEIVMPDLALDAGSLGNLRGFREGIFGAIAPDQTSDGNAIVRLTVRNTTGRVRFYVDGDYEQDAFTSMEIVGVGALLAADATFSQVAGQSRWSWNSTGFTLIDGDIYAVEFS